MEARALPFALFALLVGTAACQKDPACPAGFYRTEEGRCVNPNDPVEKYASCIIRDAKQRIGTDKGSTVEGKVETVKVGASTTVDLRDKFEKTVEASGDRCILLDVSARCFALASGEKVVPPEGCGTTSAPAATTASAAAPAASTAMPSPSASASHAAPHPPAPASASAAASAAPPVKKQQVVVDKTDNQQGSALGAPRDVTYGGSCSSGFHREQCRTVKLGGNGSCDGGAWVSTDTHDCRCKVRYTAAALASVECKVVITERED